MEQERKKEVVNICLNHFIQKGLSETSTRSLSSALKLQNAGLYYYFKTKDEAVLLCAEEAALRLENALIVPAIKEIMNPDLMFKRLKAMADKMAPTMKFLVSVCSDNKYKDGMKPILDRLTERYDYYAGVVAQKLKCEKLDIEPYVYITITAVSNYMVFCEDEFIVPQMKLVKNAIIHFANISADAG